MAKAKRNPKRLAEKLKKVRIALHLSQNELIRKLNMEEELIQSHISAYESRTISYNRIPPLGVILEYARLANLYVEQLLDDDLEIPNELPVKSKKTFY